MRRDSGELRYMLGGEPVLTRRGRAAHRRPGPALVRDQRRIRAVGRQAPAAGLPAARAGRRVGTPLAVEYLGEQYPVTVAVAGSTPLFDPANERVRR